MIDIKCRIFISVYLILIIKKKKKNWLFTISAILNRNNKICIKKVKNYYIFNGKF